MVLYDTAASGPGLAVSCNPTLPSQGPDAAEAGSGLAWDSTWSETL